MSWGMVAGWREDFNEGPYDYLGVRGEWEIFSQDGLEYRVGKVGSGKGVTKPTLNEAKEYAYENGCPRPRKKGTPL